MGFEVGLVDKNYGYDNAMADVASLDKHQFWYGCGWRYRDLFDLLVMFNNGVREYELLTGRLLSDDDNRETLEGVIREYVLPVERLGFISRLAEQLKGQSIMKVFLGLSELSDDGEEFVVEFFDSLPDSMKAAFRLSFVLDGASNDEMAVCRFFLGEFENGDTVGLFTLADAIDDLRERGVDEVLMYTSF